MFWSLAGLRGCRSPHGERGLKYGVNVFLHREIRRSPHGERGLKFGHTPTMPKTHQSLSSWRAWIEMWLVPLVGVIAAGRSPHGERGLKCRALARPDQRRSRSPHGERGLKYPIIITAAKKEKSLSSWRAWIEILENANR